MCVPFYHILTPLYTVCRLYGTPRTVWLGCVVVVLISVNAITVVSIL